MPFIRRELLRGQHDQDPWVVSESDSGLLHITRKMCSCYLQGTKSPKYPNDTGVSFVPGKLPDTNEGCVTCRLQPVRLSH